MENELGPRARQTREHILTQGLFLMQEKGFQKTSIRDICEAAEVSIGTFYSYFRDKGDLFRYRFRDKDDAFANFLNSNIEGQTAPERLLSFAKYYAWLNIGTENEELMHIFLEPGTGFHEVNTPIYNTLFSIIQAGQAAGELTGDVPPEQIVELFRVLLRGCIYEWVMQDRVFDLEARMCEYVQLTTRAFLL